MLALPRSARLVVWTNAWLTGQAPLDDVLEAVRGDDEPHTVATHSGLAVALGALRRRGLTSMRLALPAPGDPLGLVGPVATVQAGVAAGEAAAAQGTGECLIPRVTPFGPPGDVGHLVEWRSYPADAAGSDGLSLADAERELKEALIEAATVLSAADVAVWRPESGPALAAVRSGAGAEQLPDPYPSRAHGVLAQASRLTAVLQIAEQDDAAAVTTSAVATRRAALDPVRRTARRALVAACNALSEPGQPLGPEVTRNAR